MSTSEKNASTSGWLKIAAFVAGTWLLGHLLPLNPGVRMLVLVISFVALTKSLEKK